MVHERLHFSFGKIYDRERNRGERETERERGIGVRETERETDRQTDRQTDSGDSLIIWLPDFSKSKSNKHSLSGSGICP
jgi:hypothetical protein